MFHISILEGGLELCFGGAKPTKAPRGDWTVWQNFSLLFNATDLEKVMQYVKLAREDMPNFLLTSMTGTKVIHRIQVSTLLRGKICAGTILPSFEHNWLK